MKRQAPAIVPALILCALTACAENNLATELPRLEGQPVSQAVGYLGPPTEKKEISGKTTYSWVNNQTGSFYVPDAASYPAVVGGGAHPTVAFTEPGTPPIEDSYDWHCRLDIVAEHGVIVHTQYQGNTGGCETFSNKLKPLANAVDEKKLAP